MISIVLSELSYRYAQHPLFSPLSFTIDAGSKIAVIGTNGTGKSTLLRLLAGQLEPNLGKIRWYFHQNAIPDELIYRYLSWDTPAMAFYPYLTVRQTISFHYKLKPCLLPKSDPKLIALRLKLSPHIDKPIRHLSSGTLQRLKVGLALLTDAPLLLLDEPTSFMDAEHSSFCRNLIQEFAQGRTLVIASNDFADLTGCNHTITLSPPT